MFVHIYVIINCIYEDWGGIIFFGSFQIFSFSRESVYSLRCEYLHQPVGITWAPGIKLKLDQYNACVSVCARACTCVCVLVRTCGSIHETQLGAVGVWSSIGWHLLWLSYCSWHRRQCLMQLCWTTWFFSACLVFSITIAPKKYGFFEPVYFQNLILHDSLLPESERTFAWHVWPL